MPQDFISFLLIKDFEPDAVVTGIRFGMFIIADPDFFRDSIRECSIYIFVRRSPEMPAQSAYRTVYHFAKFPIAYP